MSVLFQKRAINTLANLGVPSRSRRAGSVTVNAQTAMTHSAVWACIRLRAGLISSLPVDQFRRVGGVQYEVAKDDFLIRPGSLFSGGSRITIREWLYATQVDLDKCGNTFGIRTRNALGETVRVDLLPVESVTVAVRAGVLQYKVDGQVVDVLNMWHERQYVVAGLPVGLSPVAYAAMAIGQYLSAQQFALDWFSGGGVPNATLKNTARKITPIEAQTTKERWKASVSAGDVVVLGSDWEYDMIGVQANQSEFLETQKFSVSDVCRFFDAPGDLIDAEVSTGSITYANTVSRNLQLLVMSLGPAIGRREDALTETRRKGVYVKLNTDALLRMDPKTAIETLAIGVTTRSTTPNEIRELQNKPPLTPAQEAEFARLFPQKVTAPTSVASKSEPMTLNVHQAPVDVDARSYSTIPEREVNITNEVDSRVMEGALVTSHEITNDFSLPEREIHVAPAEVNVTVEAPERAPMVRDVTTDEQGRIKTITERPI